MHDSVTGERLGVPSVSIMTDQFVSAAELMTHVLGAPGFGFVTIPHPISSASREHLHDVAAIAADACVRLLTQR